MFEAATATYDEEPASRFEHLAGTRSRTPKSESTYSADVVHITTATSSIAGQIAEGRSSPYDRALARLRSFRCWGENWDGEHAPLPNHGLINTAIDVLSLLEVTHVPVSVHLDADSRPIFFIRESEWTGEINVEDRQHISFELRSADNILDGCDLEFDGAALPIALRKAIDRVSQEIADL